MRYVDAHTRFWISHFLLAHHLWATYRATSPATRAIRLYRHFKKGIGDSRLRGGVNRYTSSVGSFIILQGINLVSVRGEIEGGGGVPRSRVYRFQWQVKYRHWRNYRARKNDFRRRQFLGGKKNYGVSVYRCVRGKSWFSTKCMYKHVARNTNWFSGFNYRKSIHTRPAKLGKYNYCSTSA